MFSTSPTAVSDQPRLRLSAEKEPPLQITDRGLSEKVARGAGDSMGIMGVPILS